MAKYPLFKDYLFEKFRKWEYKQPGHRSSFSAFARWLSVNHYGVIVGQQILSYWLKGKFEPSEDKYLLVLEQKFGQEIYNILDVPRPNPLHQYISGHLNNLPQEEQKRIGEIVAKYSMEPLPDQEKSEN